MAVTNKDGEISDYFIDLPSPLLCCGGVEGDNTSTKLELDLSCVCECGVAGGFRFSFIFPKRRKITLKKQHTFTLSPPKLSLPQITHHTHAPFIEYIILLFTQ